MHIWYEEAWSTSHNCRLYEHCGTTATTTCMYTIRFCTKSVNNSLTASTAAPSTIVLKNQGRMMRDKCLRGGKRYEQMGSSANASVIILYYRSNSTAPQEQAEPLSKVLLVGVDRMLASSLFMGVKFLNERTDAHAPEDEQGTPMGEAGGTGGISFDGIRHGFERSSCYAATAGRKNEMNKSGRPVLLERKDRGQNRCANKAQGNPTVIFGGGPLRPNFVVPRSNYKGVNERSFRRNDVYL